MAGTEAILATIGPLSTSLAGLELFMKTVIDGKPWLISPDLVSMEWRKVSLNLAGRKLKVAVMWDDGIVKPHPPIARALKRVTDSLKESDLIELVEWKPWRHDLAWEIIVSSTCPHSLSYH